MKIGKSISFKKEKTEKLDGIVYVTWTEVTDRTNPFVVEASKKGVNFSGKLGTEIFTQNELQDFAQLVGESWNEHLKLKSTIIMQSNEGMI